MKVLVIAEKPNVAEAISKAINGNVPRKEGFYEGSEYTVSWCRGHLIELFMPEDYNEEYRKWNRADLPILPDPFKYREVEDTKKQALILYSLLKKDFDHVVNACDADREGEQIFRLVYEKSESRLPVKRLWLQSTIEADIKKAFSCMKPGSDYDGLYKSAKARALSDWIIGINLSRLYSITYDARLSVGRVQTPTLAKIVERDFAIESFKPKDIFEVQAIFEGVPAKLAFDEKNTKTENKAEAEKMVKELFTVQTGTIQSLTEEEKKKAVPMPFDLATLQQDANKRFGYSAAKTLEIAQALYDQHSLITYPRTDCGYLMENHRFAFPNLLKQLCSDGFNVGITGKLIQEGAVPNPVIFNDTKVKGHHGIIPTSKSISGLSLSIEKKNVYTLIAERVIMQFMGDYTYLQSSVVIDLAGYSFIASGTKPVNLGYKALNTGNEEEEDNGAIFHEGWGEGVSVNKDSIDIVTSKTQPPAQYTEASLISFMKANHLGTEATRAGIIEQLKDVGYIEPKGKKLISTAKGRQLISVVDSRVKSVDLTSHIESKLDEIEDGKHDLQSFIKSTNSYISLVVNDTARNDSTFSAMHKATGKCFVCGSDVNARGTMWACSKEGCNFRIFQTDHFLEKLRAPNLTEEKVKTLLKDGRVLLKGLTSSKGNKYDAYLKLIHTNDEKYPTKWELEFPEDEGDQKKKVKK